MGKTLLAEALLDGMTKCNILQTNKRFALSRLLQPANSVYISELSTDGLSVDTLKQLFGAEELTVEAKFENPEVVRERIPIVATSNFELDHFCTNPEDIAALRNRIYSIKLQVPIISRQPSERQLKDLNGQPYLIRPAYEVSGIHILALFYKHFRDCENIPVYEGEKIQECKENLNWC